MTNLLAYDNDLTSSRWDEGAYFDSTCRRLGRGITRRHMGETLYGVTFKEAPCIQPDDDGDLAVVGWAPTSGYTTYFTMSSRGAIREHTRSGLRAFTLFIPTLLDEWRYSDWQWSALSDSDAEKAAYEEAVYELRSSLPSAFADSIQYDLDRIYSDKDEPIDPNRQSLRQLVGFLKANKDITCPDIFLGVYGVFKALWQPDDTRIAWIEFSPSGDAKFCAFVPNSKKRDLIDRTIGTTSAEFALERLLALGVSWIK